MNIDEAVDATISNAPQQQAQQKDPLGAAVDGVIADESATLRRNLLAAKRTSPDDAARAIRLARERGLPSEIVLRNLEQVDREQGAVDAEKVLAGAPVLSRRPAQDPTLAAAVADEHGILSKVEASIGAVARYVLGTPWNKNTPGNTLTGDLAAGMTFDLSAASAQTFRAGFETLAPILDPLADARILPANPLRAVAKEFDKLGAKAKATADQLSPPTTGIVQGGVSSGVRSLGTNLAALPAATVSVPAGLTTLIVSALVAGEFRS